MTTKRIVLIVGGVVLVVCLIIGVFAGGIIAFAFYTIDHSDATATAKNFLSNNVRLRNEVGNVNGFGRFVTGSVNTTEKGEATLKLKVIGERKTINASVNLIYLNGRTWRVTSASFENEQGETINLLNPYDSRKIGLARVPGKVA
jgi:hypothetical protein